MPFVIESPRGGSDYPRTYEEFREWFPDDASCAEYLADLRWPEGFVCPVCGGIESWRTAKGLWMCVACGRKTSVTAGTIFHRSRTPLSTWFAAAWFITSQKNGVSALTVQRMFGFGSYETAWVWLQKFRRAMVRPDRDQLGGPDLIVELDETFVGGISTGHPGASSEKLTIMVAVERVSARKLGRVRFRLSEAPGTLKLLDFATETIVPGTLIRTDGARFLRKLPDLGYRHEYSNGYESEDRSQELPGVHMVASLFKRWVAGTLHHKISEKHMPYYLDEYAFRFNRRTSSARGMLFYRLLQQSVNTDPHPLAELIAE